MTMTRRRRQWIAAGGGALLLAGAGALVAGRDTGATDEDLAQLQLQVCLAAADADVDACLDRYAETGR